MYNPTTMAIASTKREVEKQEWEERIESQQTSGLLVRKWCSENGINPKTYYYHLRAFR